MRLFLVITLDRQKVLATFDSLKEAAAYKWSENWVIGLLGNGNLLFLSGLTAGQFTWTEATKPASPLGETGRALLRNVNDAPYDVPVRQVFADFLEERGQVKAARTQRLIAQALQLSAKVNA